MSADPYAAALQQLALAGRALPRLMHAERSATVDNPLCGDRVTIDLQLDGDRIVAVGAAVRGCLLCEAASMVVARTGIAMNIADLGALEQRVSAFLKGDGEPPWAEMAVFAPVVRFRARHRCVTLPFAAAAVAARPSKS